MLSLVFHILPKQDLWERNLLCQNMFMLNWTIGNDTIFLLDRKLNSMIFFFLQYLKKKSLAMAVKDFSLQLFDFQYHMSYCLVIGGRSIDDDFLWARVWRTRNIICSGIFQDALREYQDQPCTVVFKTSQSSCAPNMQLCRLSLAC